MKKLLFILSLALSASANAQVGSDKYEGLTPEQIQQFKANMYEKFSKHQVKSIAGVEFGSSREKVEQMMTKKYGRPNYASTENDIVFSSVKYAGIDFDNVHFLFQSDGTRTYFNACIFVINAKDYNEAVSLEGKLADVLKSKYEDLVSDVDYNGNPTHGGGLSPLWDGDVDNLRGYVGALHTDIMKYDEELAKAANSKPYAVRLIYGPYEYVKEEF